MASFHRLEPRARDKGITLRWQVATTVPDLVRSDPTRIRQILLNLLSNAVKFTESGCVRFITQRSNGGVEFEVQDTGAGIPTEQLDCIFEPFWQGGQSSAGRIGGTGLGLTVSRQLAQLLGGDVQVHSTPGQGSTFTVYIPSAAPTA